MISRRRKLRWFIKNLYNLTFCGFFLLGVNDECWLCIIQFKCILKIISGEIYIPKFQSEIVITVYRTDIQILLWVAWHNQFCSPSKIRAILPPLQLVWAPRQGMETWSEEGDALPTSVSSMPVHGEKGKVVGRANFPLQLESRWETLFLSAPTVSPSCSSRTVRLAHYFKIALSRRAKHLNGLNAGVLYTSWQEKKYSPTIYS